MAKAPGSEPQGHLAALPSAIQEQNNCAALLAVSTTPTAIEETRQRPIDVEQTAMCADRLDDELRSKHRFCWVNAMPDDVVQAGIQANLLPKVKPAVPDHENGQP